MTEDRDTHPGRVWSRLTRAQKYAVMEMYGFPSARIDQRTRTSMITKGLIRRKGPGPDNYQLSGLGHAVALYRLGLGTSNLHHRSCDRVRDAEACCHPHCPVFRYYRETGVNGG